MNCQRWAQLFFAVDMSALAGFYADVLEIGIVAREVDRVVLESADFLLTVHAIPHAIACQIHIDSPPVIRESTPIKLCFPVESISATRKRALATGGEVFPDERAWQNSRFRACDGVDPEGNVFQVREAR